MGKITAAPRYRVVSLRITDQELAMINGVLDGRTQTRSDLIRMALSHAIREVGGGGLPGRYGALTMGDFSRGGAASRRPAKAATGKAGGKNGKKGCRKGAPKKKGAVKEAGSSGARSRALGAPKRGANLP